MQPSIALVDCTTVSSKSYYNTLETSVVLNDCTDVDTTITPIPMTLSLLDTTDNSNCSKDAELTPNHSHTIPNSPAPIIPSTTPPPPSPPYPTSPKMSLPIHSTLNPSAVSFPPTSHNIHQVEMVDLDLDYDDDDVNVGKSKPPSVSPLPTDDTTTNYNNTTYHNSDSTPINDHPLPSDIPSNPAPLTNNNSEFVNTWYSRLRSTDSFEAFSYQCEKFADAVVNEAKLKTPNSQLPKPRSNRPNNKDVNRNRPRILPNPIAARRIQTLFRLSKKRAARQILNDNNTVYTGT
jgi:hypothetical protein